MTTTLTRPPSALAGADPDRWDPGISAQLAEGAAAAYQYGGTVRAEALAAGWKGALPVEIKNSQLVVLWSPHALMVSVRGSDERADWVANLRGILRCGWDPYLPPGCTAGIGWLSQAKRIRDELVKALVPLRGEFSIEDVPLFMAGHSAGGPIVTLLAIAIERDLGEVPKLINTFSAPRGLNRAGGRWFDAKWPQTWGIVPTIRGAIDPVTLVPPDGFPTFARQVGRRIILADGRALQQPEDWDALQAKRLKDQKAAGVKPGERWLARWRFLSRAIEGATIHPIEETVGVLRKMAAEAEALEAEREAARVSAEVAQAEVLAAAVKAVLG